MVKLITRAELKDSVEHLNEAIEEINMTLSRDYDGSQSVINVNLSNCKLHKHSTIKTLFSELKQAGYDNVGAIYGNDTINSIYITM